MSRIAITGMGLVDTLGNNPTECWENYLNKPNEPEAVRDNPHPGVEGLKVFYADGELDKPDFIRGPLYAGLQKSNRLAVHSVHQALKDMPKSSNVGVVYSSGGAEEETRMHYAGWLFGMKKRLRPKQQLQQLNSYVSSLISLVWDFNGASIAQQAACSTTLYSLDLGIKMLECDDYDYVVVGAAESCNHTWVLSFFRSLGALGTHSAPFDKGRDGFIMGEASGTMVLEKEEHAIARGAKIYGYIHGVGLSNDAAAQAPTAPDPEGKGIKLAINRAMKKGDSIDPYKVGSHWGSQIAFVGAHATSTPAGDGAEYNAIQEMFPGVPVTSFKSKIGHGLTSASVSEMIYMIQALAHNTVPPNHNIKDTEYTHVPTSPSPSTKSFALKTSLGFGGKNAAGLIEKGPDLWS